jgi:hypothetical protein
MKRILIILSILPYLLSAQVDYRYTNQYCVITDKLTDSIIINEYIISARVETNQNIIRVNDLNKVNISILTDAIPELPDIGWLQENQLYAYNNQVIQVIQSHYRTIYLPEETPALFSFYREDTGDLEWISNEKVNIGDIRTYKGIEYECIQAHMTLEAWTPDVTPALWQAVQGEECPKWIQPTGAHDAYNIGDCVLFNGKCYESKINANVWSPAVYPAGWQEIKCP